MKACKIFFLREYEKKRVSLDALPFFPILQLIFWHEHNRNHSRTKITNVKYFRKRWKGQSLTLKAMMRTSKRMMSSVEDSSSCLIFCTCRMVRLCDNAYPKATGCSSADLCYQSWFLSSNLQVISSLILKKTIWIRTFSRVGRA